MNKKDIIDKWVYIKGNQDIAYKIIRIHNVDAIF